MSSPHPPSPFALPPAPQQLRIETERLVLRPLIDDDVDRMVAYRGDPEVCRYLPFPPQSADDIRARIGHILGSSTLLGENGGIPVGIFRASDDQLIGDLVLFHLDEQNGSVEIGWVLHPGATGQGYATEAVTALVDAAFRIYGIRRVVARIDAENRASAQLAERVGMRLEAHLVENTWFAGRWGDELDYGLLAREWPAAAAASSISKATDSTRAS
ncbi:GNAT family N-acetyltransferase [Homoserinibacter sp. GY 40078]|uniref:GNAT family N-acetyltransferase n=1 Tax=Homoserinibacter sp. GY 40078 TaxID=2603275 RepID=UPI0011C97719|nr:GNAT family protein [Homoserinibacter sp. GY 40078]TXK17460.1 GNAT family N-acetyltransferase [Homoserinibacter sp. GY 40078]